MFLFITKRLLQGTLVLWGVVTLLFLLFHVLGNPIDYVVGEHADAQTRQELIKKYGLDQTRHVQYLRYLAKLFPYGYYESIQGDASTLKFGFHLPDLGFSIQQQKPVSELIMERAGGSAILALTALLIAALLGISLGVMAGRHPGSWIDRLIVSTSVLGVSAPSFFVAILLIAIFAVALHDFTGLDIGGYLLEPNLFGEGYQLKLSRLILPAFALGIRPLAVFIQLTRASMISVMQQDYIRTARAKGLSERKVVWRHAFKNLLTPLISAVTNWLASLLAGAFFVEYVCNWKGVGKLAIDALLERDFPLIIGCTLFVGLIFVGVNILTDLLYKWNDKRVVL